MDSIGDNVMAIICVVVGILIIGCALVPVVDNASEIETETVHVQTTGGLNTLASGSWLGPITEVSITTDGSTTITVDGETFTGDYYLVICPSPGPEYAYINPETKVMAVQPLFDGGSSLIRFNSGSITYADGVLTITGTTRDNVEYDKSLEVDELYISGASEYSFADETDWYGLVTSPVTIGDGQKIISQNGQTVITMETATLPAGMTMTKNDNENFATVTFSSGSWYGPYEWAGTITTTETTTSESEYAGLYNMIPVLCILGMAYVLIRRFY